MLLTIHREGKFVLKQSKDFNPTVLLHTITDLQIEVTRKLLLEDTSLLTIQQPIVDKKQLSVLILAQHVLPMLLVLVARTARRHCSAPQSNDSFVLNVCQLQPYETGSFY